MNKERRAGEGKNPDANPMGGAPAPVPKGPRPGAGSPAAKLFKEKKGYANYYFNELERDRLLAAAKKHGDFTTVPGTWVAEGKYLLSERNGDLRYEVSEGKGNDATPLVKLKLNIEQQLEPLKGGALRDLMEPLGSGGLMMALYHYHRFLTVGMKGFEFEFSHALVRDAVLADIAPLRRARLNARVAASLEHSGRASKLSMTCHEVPPLL